MTNSRKEVPLHQLIDNYQKGTGSVSFYGTFIKIISESEKNRFAEYIEPYGYKIQIIHSIQDVLFYIDLISTTTSNEQKKQA